MTRHKRNRQDEVQQRRALRAARGLTTQLANRQPFDERLEAGRAAARRARKKLREADPERVREYKRQYLAARTVKQRRDHTLWQGYGLRLVDEERMLTEQGGGCAICKQLLPLPESGPCNNRHIDHDHATHAIRGVLCSACNNLLGRARDSVEILQSAIEYLIWHDIRYTAGVRL